MWRQCVNECQLRQIHGERAIFDEYKTASMSLKPWQFTGVRATEREGERATAWAKNVQTSFCNIITAHSSDEFEQQHHMTICHQPFFSHFNCYIVFHLDVTHNWCFETRSTSLMSKIETCRLKPFLRCLFFPVIANRVSVGVAVWVKVVLSFHLSKKQHFKIL